MPGGSGDPSRGGGSPPGEGSPSGGGGPPGGGNPPGGEDANQLNIPCPWDCFIGKEPQVFTGDRTKADEFFTQWNLFIGVNFNNPTMTNTFSRAMLFLTYLQGPHVNEWVLAQHQWLVNEVTNNGIHPADINFWTTIERAFRRNFADMLEQEHTQCYNSVIFVRVWFSISVNSSPRLACHEGSVM